MPNPLTDPPGAYWVDGSGGGTGISAADLNARELSMAGAPIPLLFQRDTAAIGYSARFIAPGAGTITKATLSTVGAPAGSALVVNLRKNGSTVANGTFTIADGSTTTDDKTFAVTFVAGDYIDVNVTSAGSGTPAANILLTVWLSIPVHGTSAAPTFDSVVAGIANITSYWKLQETSGTTAADSLGSNPGVYVGTPALAQSGIVANPLTDTSVLFNGTTNIVTIAGTSALQAPSFTAWAWLSIPSAPGTERTLMTIADSCVGISMTTSRTCRGYIWNGSINSFTNGTVVVATNTATLVAYTYDNVSHIGSLYVNGALDASSGSASVAYTPSVYTSSLGAALGPTSPINAKLEKCGYVARALSSTEHLALRNAGI